ncbi:hypothetical protein NQ314_008435 [Rhamnusium bicolor]|uniref:Uncharacterized protein n=1 Tax=Rhamnusium bicolor TaxID=1586634 RepID=A0AAV8YA79_9CUCU|nr:hypothetical protein NQ314_008435 [Rhamnusium bicolor]
MLCVSLCQLLDFRVLSRNGSLSEYTGFNVDEKAPLTILTAGEVVARVNDSKNADIALLLRGIELEFGQRLEKILQGF